MNIFFMALLVILAITGMLYGWYQHGYAQIIADNRSYEKIQNLEASHELQSVHANELQREVESLQSDLHIANQRIKLLESAVRVGMKRMPTGSLSKAYTRKLEVEKADPTATGILPKPELHPDDLPPIQLI